MGFFRNQLIDIIEWLDDTRDTLVWRYPRGDNEIKYNAKLVVREGQAAAFINEGKLADVFYPGTYTLETKNLPILGDLKGWKYGFESPFKAEVYYVSTRAFTDRKWGTKNPIMMRDPEFGPVRLRAFGSFSIKVADPANFLRTVVGTDSRFTLDDDFFEQLRSTLVARFSDVLGQSKIPVLDLAGNQDELSKFVCTNIAKDFEAFGLQLVSLVIENISLPPEVEAAMDKRTSMGVIGNLNAYTQFQAANALPDAAKNSGGLAGAGAGLGMGMFMAGQVNQSLSNQQSGAGMPPPIPQAAAYFIAVNGQQAGPFDESALKQKVSAGELKRETLIWKQGMAAWVPASSVSELASLFAAVPPPIPQAPSA